MKMQSVCGLMMVGVVLNAETVVVRHPGLVESVGQAAVGTVQCVGEMAKGLVAGNTTVIQSNGANAVIATPATSPVVVSPAVPLMPYGAYYGGYCGYRHYYGGYGRPYWRPYRHCYGGWYGCGASRDLCNAAAITGLVANSLQAVSAVTCPVAIANPVAPIVTAQPPAVAVPAPAVVAPQPAYVSAPAPCVAPTVVAPYGRSGRVVYYGF